MSLQEIGGNRHLKSSIATASFVSGELGIGVLVEVALTLLTKNIQLTIKNPTNNRIFIIFPIGHLHKKTCVVFLELHANNILEKSIGHQV